VDGFRQYFEKFGEVEQVEIVGHPRGFGFIVFEERDSAERCLQNKHHTVNGKKVEVKECSTNETSVSNSQNSKRQLTVNNKSQRNNSPDYYHRQNVTRPSNKKNEHVLHDNYESLSDFPHLGADGK
jgi:RNA recognition motif-containing protein